MGFTWVFWLTWNQQQLDSIDGSLLWIQTRWIPVSFQDIGKHNNLQDWALDTQKGVHAISRLTIDTRQIQLPKGYDHIGAGDYDTAANLYVPIEDTNYLAPLFLM